MIALWAAAAFLSSSQPTGAPAPLVVELCNTTRTQVAYSIVYRGPGGGERRRGWLNVAPNDCIEGSIGNTVGGTAHVHAFSGSYRWPASGATRDYCSPSGAHDSAARRPDCSSNERAAGFEPVDLVRGRSNYGLSYTVSCSDLGINDALLCEQGRRDSNGFAELVRTVEVCNWSRAPISVAAVGESESTRGLMVNGWMQVDIDTCEAVWRGLSADRVAYVYWDGARSTAAAHEFARVCVDPEADFSRPVQSTAESACPPGLEVRAFQPVRFGRTMSRMSLDVGE